MESEGKRTTRHVAGIGSGGVPRSTVRATTRGVGADLPTGIPAEGSDTVRGGVPETDRPGRGSSRDTGESDGTDAVVDSDTGLDA